MADMVNLHCSSKYGGIVFIIFIKIAGGYPYISSIVIMIVRGIIRRGFVLIWLDSVIVMSAIPAIVIIWVIIKVVTTIIAVILPVKNPITPPIGQVYMYIVGLYP